MCMNFMFVVYFLFKKNCFYIEFFLSFKSFSRMFVFFFAFFFVFCIFIRIIESIKIFDSNHNIKKSNKIFENSFFLMIKSLLSSKVLFFNQSDKMYSLTASLLQTSFFQTSFFSRKLLYQFRFHERFFSKANHVCLIFRRMQQFD